MAISTIGSDGLASSAVTRPKIGYAGAVLQVVNVQSSSLTSTTTIIPTDNTIPQNTEGAELFTLAITPTSATSKLLISVVVFATNTTSGWSTIAIFQDSTANAIAANLAYNTTATAGSVIPLNYYMTAGTTSSTTFKVRYGPNTGSTTVVNGSGATNFFGGVCISSMTITELAT